MFQEISLQQVESKMAVRLHTLLPPETPYQRLTDLMALTMGAPGIKGRCLSQFFDILKLRAERLWDTVEDIMQVREAMDLKV